MREKRAISSEAARKLSGLGAAKGGVARAAAMTPEQRSESARRAVEARWAKKGIAPIPKATHIGNMQIGDLTLECAVLENGDRVLSQRGFMAAVGIKHGGTMSTARVGEDGAIYPLFIAFRNLRPFIDSELLSVLNSPSSYRHPNGGIAFAIKAELIPRVCEVWLKARDTGALRATQIVTATKADILMRGLAHVGIVALVDEATGFQDDRDRRALAKILEAFVAKELKPWVHTFPVDYYKELFRLRGLVYPPKGNKMPRYFGVLTNDIVYARLAPGVLNELRRVTPRDEKGRLKNHLHRRLTDDVGHPKLLQHLGAVVTVMKFSPDKDYDSFKKLLDKHYPRQTPAPLFDKPEDEAANGEVT